MKIFNSKSAIFLILISVMAISCGSVNAPKVTNATYDSFQTNQEKGYLVHFTVSHDKMWPKSIILNRIQQEVDPSSKDGLNYSVRVLAESRVLMGFRPHTTEQSNGILFKNDTTEVFKEVDFQLVEN